MLRKLFASLILLAVCSAPLTARAQRSLNQRFVRHSQWRPGFHLPPSDWDRGDRIPNPSRYRLRRPPPGYEWRRIDGNFVMATSDTGIIASVIVTSVTPNRSGSPSSH